LAFSSIWKYNSIGRRFRLLSFFLFR
jgi:hypothetical protein